MTTRQGRTRMWWRAGARHVVAALILCCAVPARAQRPSTELPPAAHEVFDGVMSPFCPGLLLRNCPSPQADSLRRAIAVRAAGGATRAQIVEELIATYGDAVRAEPARRGFGLVAWVAPALGLLLAFGWLTRRLARATRTADGRRPQPLVAAEATDEATDDATSAERAALAALLRNG